MRTALVQGASRGLGLAFTEALLSRAGVERVVATSRNPEDSPDLLRLREASPQQLLLVPLDVRQEASIARAAETISAGVPRLDLLLNVAGILHEGDHIRPEKKLEDLDPAALRHAFEVNAFGPLLVARHFLDRLRHGERAVVANISARIGSIGDNRAGGWYAYRASKAAQNMFTRTLSIELGRRAPQVICVALHPGTVDTELSKPFQRSVPDGRLFDPKRAADQLLAVIDGLRPEQSGAFLAWDGQPIPW